MPGLSPAAGCRPWPGGIRPARSPGRATPIAWAYLPNSPAADLWPVRAVAIYPSRRPLYPPRVSVIPFRRDGIQERPDSLPPRQLGVEERLGQPQILDHRMPHLLAAGVIGCPQDRRRVSPLRLRPAPATSPIGRPRTAERVSDGPRTAATAVAPRSTSPRGATTSSAARSQGAHALISARVGLSRMRRLPLARET